MPNLGEYYTVRVYQGGPLYFVETADECGPQRGDIPAEEGGGVATFAAPADAHVEMSRRFPKIARCSDL